MMQRSLCTWRDKIFTATLPLRRMMIIPQILMDSWRFSRLHRFWYLRKSHQREVKNFMNPTSPALKNQQCRWSLAFQFWWKSGANLHVPVKLWNMHSWRRAFGVWQNVCSSSLGVSTIEVWFFVGAQPPTPPWNGEMRQAKTLAQDPHLRYSAVGAGAGAAVMGAGGFCAATSVGFRSKASVKSSNRHH